MKRAAVALVILAYAAALGAHWIAPRGYAYQDRAAVSAPPSSEFPLGTDELGRDVFARVVWGSRVSLLLAPAAALLATMVAAALGGFAGWCGGAVESVAMRASDLFLSLPWLFVLMAVRAALPLNVCPEHSVLITFLLLGGLGWAGPARIVCSAVRSLRGREDLFHARATGAGPARLILRHVLPNLRPVLAAQFWMSIPLFIVSETNLGVLGLGVSDPLPSWGGLLRGLENVSAVTAHPWMLAPLAVFAVVMASLQVAVTEYSK